MAGVRLWSRNFVGCCLASFFYFGGFYLLLPVLPLYVEQLGGLPSEIGLAVGLFTFLSVVVRPHSGKLGDRYGLKRFMLLGAMLFTVMFVCYFGVTDLMTLYVVRVLHGVAHGIFLAAVFAYVGSIAPQDRRGEAMGVFGMANVVAMAIFPALGTKLVQSFGDFTELFGVAVAMAAVAMLAVLSVEELCPCARQTGGVSLRRIICLKPVWLAFVTYISAAIAYGTVVTFLSVYATEIGITEFGQFFIVYALFTLVSRGVAGKLSDKFGRYAVVVPFMVLIFLAMVLLAVLANLPMLWACAMLFGLGFGAFMPALNAYIIDETRPEDRSGALAIFSSAMDIGITAGAVALGAVSEMAGYAVMYGVSASLVLGGLLLFALVGRRTSQKYINI